MNNQLVAAAGGVLNSGADNQQHGRTSDSWQLPRHVVASACAYRQANDMA